MNTFYTNAGNLVKTAIPTNRTWLPTVINPAKDGGEMQKALWWLHVIVWVVALGLGSASNFGVVHFQAKSNDCTDTATDCFAQGPTDTTIVVGILGGTATILGVVAILGGAASFDAEAYKTQVWLHVITQFFTLFGSCATFFVWCKAAEKDAAGAFWIGAFATAFQLYAQVLLYCTSDTLETMALPRSFISCFAVSVQLVSAIAISGGDWRPDGLPAMLVAAIEDLENRQKQSSSAPPAPPPLLEEHFTPGQKFAAWALPVAMSISIILMVVFRRWTRDSKTEISALGQFPFLRSLVLTPFLLSGILAIYKLSFVKADSDPTGFMFALLGMLLNFAIITVVFVPGSVAASADATPMTKRPLLA